MKQKRIAKIFFCCVLAVPVAGATFLAQNPAPNTQQPSKTPPSTQPPGPRGQNPPPQPGGRGESSSAAAPNTNFLNTAIEINAAEVQLGQLATTKAQSSRVKTFAQMMIKDHSMGLEKLQRLQADGKREPPPLSAQHQELKTRLSGMSGADFDRNYIDAMVMGHREAIKLFEQEITGAPSRPQSAVKPTENDVASVARELLPTIKRHLAEAEKVQKSLESRKGTTSSERGKNAKSSSP